MAAAAAGLALASCAGASKPVPAARITPRAPAPVGSPVPAEPPVAAADKRAPAPSPRPGSHPGDSVYPSLGHGFDVSYPQCVEGHPPAGAGFSVVGVNGGKAFTANPCLAAQWRAAPQPRALYLNSGFNPDNLGKASADCRRLAASLEAPGNQRDAYAIGCAEATHSLGVMRDAGVAGPVMYWVDVEPSNSWDESNLDLNRFALEGEIDQLAAFGRPVGIYSTFPEWGRITGGWQSAAVNANWVAGRLPADACSAPGFTGAPVWIAQEAATWPDSGYDSDWAC